ncbi:hypothetical protein KUTeg_002589 [Tegillarca granosa]|uniref:VTT domain-containing protein n=1 Tax=Tegillarca granosa TaxID=220873 RepID=A0ABQ9FW31_TEGGR|nr:hypothetical protein KUTeg_002589 [Tegillarca granosa]
MHKQDTEEVLAGDVVIFISSIKFPTSLEDLTVMTDLLQQYQTEHFSYVLLLFCSAYLYKQTFAIPGSVFMNLLAGALFGVWRGFPLVCVLTATGATFCYLISRLCGRYYIMKFFPEKVKFMQEKVENNMDSLFFFLLFLRFFPMSPNWFLNMASPILNVPVYLFFPSVLIGLMPFNFICVQTGCMLSELTSMDNIFSTWTLLKLSAIALTALLPGLIVQRIKHGRLKTD